jgi:hypothetical protein
VELLYRGAENAEAYEQLPWRRADYILQSEFLMLSLSSKHLPAES